MKKRICIEASMADKLEEFLKAEEIKIEVLTQGDCDVRIFPCEARKESDLNTIYSHGWIGCETARALAAKLGVPVGQMGKLLNYLDVKIRKCGLGCFE
ncbi:MAG: hypothetical protein ACYSSI_03235 [Planctomycetota bacterium]|jgi:hypothetical protein